MENSRIKIRKFEENDRKSIIDTFNYYIENSMYAFPESKVEYSFFDMLLNLSQVYPSAVLFCDGEFAGFGFVRPYSPISTFKTTAEIGYFLAPEFTAKGLGQLVHDYLIKDACKKKIKNIIATISETNDSSVKFHIKNSYEKCGHIKNAGTKHGNPFNIILMQKCICENL